MDKTAIITGITGQDGAYLAKFLLQKNYNIIGIVRKNSDVNLKNFKFLDIEDRIEIRQIDLMSFDEIKTLLYEISPNEIYNLAAQSSVGRSFLEPDETIRFNINSVLNLLESIRQIDPRIKLYQASSSEMYGQITDLPITENSPLNPVSPYATSKATAHWMIKNYRVAYGMFAVSGILFNHESYLRDDNFFVKKVIRQSIEINKGLRNMLYVGNIDIKRDFGYGPDYIKLMWKMLQVEEPDDFIICSGKSISLKEIIYYIFKKLSISNDKLVVKKELYRPEEIKDIYGDNKKAKKLLNWNYNKDFFDVLDILFDEEIKNFK